MIRKAFLMEVKPGMIDAYEKSHNPIWPELYETLKSHGLKNYSIFYHEETNQLFGYVEIDDVEKFNKLPEQEICRKWWAEMKKYLVCKAPGDSKAKEDELRMVFHID